MQLKLYEAFLAQHKAQVQAGLVKEVHANLDGVTGYYVSADISHEKMQMVLQQWAPFVTCTCHQATPLTTAISNFIEITKQRIAMMK
ncbi:MAG: hypothetical protein L3K09_00015 [Thermoplasmata archaeon]|nr:hypothetical protein [Thermoplasmata archaeon]